MKLEINIEVEGVEIEEAEIEPEVDLGKVKSRRGVNWQPWEDRAEVTGINP